MNQCEESMKQHSNFQRATAGLNQFCPVLNYPQFSQHYDQQFQSFYYQSMHLDTFTNQSLPVDFIEEDDQNRHSQVNSNSVVTNQQEAIKFVKLPSIEYIVQEQEKKSRQIGLMLFKLHNLSDFYKSKPSFTSREVISQKTLDTGNHQLKELFGDKNIKKKHLSNMKNAILVQQPCPQLLAMFNLQKEERKNTFFLNGQIVYNQQSQITKPEDNILKEQHQLKGLKVQNKQLERLYIYLKSIKHVKNAQYKFSKQAMCLLKQIIQKMQITK